MDGHGKLQLAWSSTCKGSNPDPIVSGQRALELLGVKQGAGMQEKAGC